MIAGLLDRDEYFWLDLDAPSNGDVDTLDDIFHFHPLALEDLRKKGQRPKLEDFGGYMFLVYYGAKDPDGGGGSTWKRSTPSSAAATWSPSTTAIAVPSTTSASGSTRCRRALSSSSSTARHIDDILEVPGLEADSRNYFRDVYDHAIRISDQIDAYRDLLIGSRDAYLSVTSNRLNEITKQLTVIATIFLPLSFVVGFFGQNFKWMVERMTTFTEFLAIGGGSIVLSLMILFIWLRRSSYA